MKLLRKKKRTCRKALAPLLPVCASAALNVKTWHECNRQGWFNSGGLFHHLTGLAAEGAT